MKFTEQSSNTLNYLKCILCIAVVFIHARYFPDLSLLGIQNIADYGVYNAIEIYFTELSDVFFIDQELEN